MARKGMPSVLSSFLLSIMLPPSVRRVVAAAPQSPVVAAAFASPVPRAAGAYALSYRPNSHQRRLSSSKPSSPDNGPKDFSARPSVHPSSDRAKSGDSKSPGEKRKRKAKEAAAPAAKPLPSVPSTQHLSQEALALSTFFSLHRPISVTHSFPKTITEDAFAEIFSQRAKSHRPSDVISTLSHTVHDLEQPLSKLSLNGKQLDADDQAHDAMTRLNLKHADGSETSVYLQLNAMSGQFLPFRPPPPPDAQAAESEVETAPAEAAEEAMQTRVYKAILTIEETTDADGQYKVVAHSPQLIEEDSVPRTFLERMALRQLRYEDARQRADDSMEAISVKRQRKLKMKKKKYKKLMRRTRNLRRKLDRT
ncbi:hypothetical protein GQ53DRAFT_873389 [Thozetella sp. PMI_491]|nr:hypothetical protein GQ53DRAFT_873389 [Thozetella sp. PMI_491]